MTGRTELEVPLLADGALTTVILDHLGDAASVAVGTTRVYVNDAYLKLYGLSDRSEAIGQPVYDHVAPEERGEVAERIESLQLGELPLGELYEYTVYGRDGQERIVQIRGMPVKYHGQAASISIHRDITGRVRAEQELKRILSLYKATLGSTADGILVVDLAGKVVNYNLRFMQMWQMTSEILDSDYKHPGQQR